MMDRRPQSLPVSTALHSRPTIAVTGGKGSIHGIAPWMSTWIKNIKLSKRSEKLADDVNELRSDPETLIDKISVLYRKKCLLYRRRSYLLHLFLYP